jgi:hypothetical protein
MSCSVLSKSGKECSREGIYAGCCSKHAMEKLENSLDDTRLNKVVKANDGKHKFVAIFMKNGHETHVPFGSKGMNDFTLFSNKTEGKVHRDRYRTRHAKDLYTLDPTRAGYLSYYILWGDSTSIDKNIQAYKKKFNL